MMHSLRLRSVPWLVFPLLAVFSPQPAFAVAVGGVRAVAQRLGHATNVAVYLPARVPDSLTSQGVYAEVASASASAYVVNLTTTPTCGAATACLIGSVGGFARPQSVPGGRAVTLADGSAADVGPSTIVFRRGAAWYRLRIAGASPYALKMMAMSLRRY